MSDGAPTIAIKRIYDPPTPDDGLRLLVDRLWPRGVSKAAAAIDHWFRELAPSDALRRWYGHDPAKWDEVVVRYHAELDANPATAELDALLATTERATLLFAAKEPLRNNAEALRRWLVAR